MKPINVKSDAYTQYKVDYNAKNAKFKTGDHVRISMYLLYLIYRSQLLYKMSQYFPKPFEHSARNMNFKLNLSNYATKADLKRATSVDASNLAAKSDSASLKVGVDKIDRKKIINCAC